MAIVAGVLDHFSGLISRFRRGKDRIWCNKAWDTASVLCDGTVVCYCYDPFSIFSFGNIHQEPFSEIWNNAKYRELRRSLLRGGNDHCRACFAAGKLQPGQKPPERQVVMEKGPRVLFIEPTVKCNLQCINVCGSREIEKTRQKLFMDMETFRALMDDVGHQLEYILLYYYGEPFLNKDIIEMIEYARKVNDKAIIQVHSNGNVPLSEEKIERLVRSGLDELIFSVDGACQESYEKYRRGGNFQRAMNNMARIVEVRDRLGLKKPKIIWKYLLFEWNDSDEEMDRARELADRMKIDKLGWMITSGPEGAPSKRFVHGSEELDKIMHEVYDLGAFY